MRRRFQSGKRVTALILCFLVCTRLRSAAWSASVPSEQSPPISGVTLSWEDCVRIALADHPALVAARQQVRAARAGITAVQSDLRPQVSLSAGAEYAEADGQSSSDNPFVNAALSAEQVLYSGGRKSAAIDTTRAALATAIADYRATHAEVTYRLRTAFVNLWIAQARAKLLEHIEQRRRDNLELVRLRYEGGREHKGSLAMIEAAYFQAQIERRQAVRGIETDRRILLQTMGLTNEVLDIAVKGDLAAAPPPNCADLAALVEQTPNIARALAMISSARAALHSAESGYRPDIRLVGSAGRSGATESFENNHWSVGVRLSFPLWPGGRTRYEVAQAEARLTLADAQLADQRNRLMADLADTLCVYQNAAEDQQVQAHFFEAADLRADVARQQYGAGLLTFENWDVIENDRISYQRRLLESQRTALLAEAAWNYAVGYDAFAAFNENTP